MNKINASNLIANYNLDLSHKKITHIENLSIIKHLLYSLNLEKNNITDLVNIFGTKDLCYPMILWMDFSFNSLNEITVLQDFKGELIHSVNLSHNNLTKLHRMKGMPHLAKLYVTHNKLEMFQLQDFKYLDQLYFSHNKLQKLFYIPSKLRVLDCSNNLITFIEQDVLPKNLEILNLSNNKLIILPEKLIMQNLSVINLSNNELTKIPIIKSECSISIDISYNKLPYVPHHLAYFCTLKKLTCTPLQINRLTFHNINLVMSDDYLLYFSQIIDKCCYEYQFVIPNELQGHKLTFILRYILNEYMKRNNIDIKLLNKDTNLLLTDVLSVCIYFDKKTHLNIADTYVSDMIHKKCSQQLRTYFHHLVEISSKRKTRQLMKDSALIERLITLLF